MEGDRLVGPRRSGSLHDKKRRLKKLAAAGAAAAAGDVLISPCQAMLSSYSAWAARRRPNHPGARGRPNKRPMPSRRKGGAAR